MSRLVLLYDMHSANGDMVCGWGPGKNTSRPESSKAALIILQEERFVAGKSTELHLLRLQDTPEIPSGSGTSGWVIWKRLVVGTRPQTRDRGALPVVEAGAKGRLSRHPPLLHPSPARPESLQGGTVVDWLPR